MRRKRSGVTSVFCCQHIFMLPSLSVLCPGPVQPVIYRLKGQQVQLNPVITGKPEEILWKHSDSKVVEFSGADEQVFGSYEGRVSLDRLNARLQISDLCLEDSGKYEYEIYIQRKWFQSSYELQVMGKKLIFFHDRFQVYCLWLCFLISLQSLHIYALLFWTNINSPHRESCQTHHHMWDEPLFRVYHICSAAVLSRTESTSVTTWVQMDFTRRSSTWQQLSNIPWRWTWWAAIHLSSEQPCEFWNNNLHSKRLQHR